MSMGFLVEESSAMVWRGLMVSTCWYLVVNTFVVVCYNGRLFNGLAWTCSKHAICYI